MRNTQVRGSHIVRRDRLHALVESTCSEALALTNPHGVALSKWKRAQKIFTKRLRDVVKKMDRYDDRSVPYFEERVRAKTYEGAEASVLRALHKFVGL